MIPRYRVLRAILPLLEMHKYMQMEIQMFLVILGHDPYRVQVLAPGPYHVHVQELVHDLYRAVAMELVIVPYREIEDDPSPKPVL